MISDCSWNGRILKENDLRVKNVVWKWENFPKDIFLAAGLGWWYFLRIFSSSHPVICILLRKGSFDIAPLLGNDQLQFSFILIISILIISRERHCLKYVPFMNTWPFPVWLSLIYLICDIIIYGAFFLGWGRFLRLCVFGLASSPPSRLLSVPHCSAHRSQTRSDCSRQYEGDSVFLWFEIFSTGSFWTLWDY